MVLVNCNDVLSRCLYFYFFVVHLIFMLFMLHVVITVPVFLFAFILSFNENTLSFYSLFALLS